MIYVWKCKACSTETEVERKMADIEAGPDNGCSACNSADLERVIQVKKNVKGFLLNGGGWHDDNYTSTRSRN